MSDEENIDPKHRFNPYPLTAWISVIIAFYFLSTGPVVFLFERGIISQPMADSMEDTFYAPIGWLLEHSTWFDHIFRGYIKLWK